MKSKCVCAKKNFRFKFIVFLSIKKKNGLYVNMIMPPQLFQQLMQIVTQFRWKPVYKIVKMVRHFMRIAYILIEINVEWNFIHNSIVNEYFVFSLTINCLHFTNTCSSNANRFTQSLIFPFFYFSNRYLPRAKWLLITLPYLQSVYVNKC